MKSWNNIPNGDEQISTQEYICIDAYFGLSDIISINVSFYIGRYKLGFILNQCKNTIIKLMKAIILKLIDWEKPRYNF